METVTHIHKHIQHAYILTERGNGSVGANSMTHQRYKIIFVFIQKSLQVLMRHMASCCFTYQCKPVEAVTLQVFAAGLF